MITKLLRVQYTTVKEEQLWGFLQRASSALYPQIPTTENHS